jgi:hypothetical protein
LLNIHLPQNMVPLTLIVGLQLLLHSKLTNV